MSPNGQSVLAGFEAYPHPREGFTMLFRGNAPNDKDEFEGEYVEIELIVPPLSFHSLQQIQARRKARNGSATPQDAQADVVETIYLALRRNYRGVPRWLIEQSLDGPIMAALAAKMTEMVGLSEEKKTPAENPPAS